MNLEEYHPGSGCECFARHEDECGCDADWTPREVYALRAENSELRDLANEYLGRIIEYEKVINEKK